MNERVTLKERVIQIGYDSRGRCSFIRMERFFILDEESFGIPRQKIKQHGIRRLVGFFFDRDGRLLFESVDIYHPRTGKIEDGCCRPVGSLLKYLRKEDRICRLS